MTDTIKALGILAVKVLVGGVIAGTGFTIGSKLTNEATNLVFGKSKIGEIEVKMPEDKKEEKKDENKKEG